MHNRAHAQQRSNYNSQDETVEQRKARHAREKKERFVISFIFLTGILAIVLTEYIQYKFFIGNRSLDNGPCPIPTGDYKYTCTDINSELLPNKNECSFTALCANNDRVDLYSIEQASTRLYGQYGDTCPDIPLLKSTLILPAFHQYSLISNICGKPGAYGMFIAPYVHGKIISTTPVEDKDCTIRRQFADPRVSFNSDATIAQPSVIVGAVTTLAALKLAL